LFLILFLQPFKFHLCVLCALCGKKVKPLDLSTEKEMIMGTAKKILAAIGFNRYTQDLLSYALEIAESMNAELIIANIINARDVEAVATIAAMGYDVDSGKYVAVIKAERQQELDEILKNIGRKPGKIRTLFKTGDPGDELLKIAVKENVDLIVMGIKGRTDLEYIFVGSVAEKVFRRSPIPVLSFRDEVNAERLRKHIDLS
jgi:nucleotide-binding universal stress UspA family protein